MTKITPTQTVKKYCLHCVGGVREDVVNCTGLSCLFYPYRLGDKRISVKVIRQFCRECSGNDMDSITNCPSTDCYCYPFRMGKNPSRKGVGANKIEMEQVSARKHGLSREKRSSFQFSQAG